VARRLKAAAKPRSSRAAPAPRLLRIELDGASLRLGAHWALREVAFTVRRGEHWLLRGPNGAGKTVLLKLLRGDLWPTPTSTSTSTSTARATRRYLFAGGAADTQPLRAFERIAYIGPERQDRYERYESTLDVAQVVLTGYDDTDLPLQPATAAQRRRIKQLLQAVGLDGLERRPFRTLSYGQRRRALLARALVRRPDVLLLDEALNGLDARGRAAFLRALRAAAPARTAWILTSHRHGDLPADVTHVAHIEAGRLQVAAEGRAHADPPRPPRASRAAHGGPGRGATLLRLERASVHRDGGPTVIASLDWTLRRGEHWQLRGRNGAGKSTLIALLYGDLWPAHGGRLERAPRNVEDWKRATGLVSPELQANYAATGCTVEEIVSSGFDASIGLNAWPTPVQRRRVRRELRAWGLDSLARRRARELSYGQLRRALVARAFLLSRRLYLLDEPFDGLDAATRALFRLRLEAAVRRGATVVLATHHDEDVPAWVESQLWLRRGRVPRATGAAGQVSAPSRAQTASRLRQSSGSAAS
jgi:molybdate transport system ATP-binding protein